jgi:hypothetical protein
LKGLRVSGKNRDPLLITAGLVCRALLSQMQTPVAPVTTEVPEEWCHKRFNAISLFVIHTWFPEISTPWTAEGVDGK